MGMVKILNSQKQNDTNTATENVILCEEKTISKCNKKKQS